MVEVALHPGARREYRAAVQWYLDRNRRAAGRFVSDVEHVLAQIGTQPDRFGWYDDEFREAVLLHFPFSVLYRVNPPGDVLVVAVAHAGREPDYWRDRA